MKSFNLSAWALANRSLVIFLMGVVVAAGVSAFFKLGRNEDPAFTIRTMVVAAAWPGATTEETLLQVTERLERTLQEVPNLDYLESYTDAGSTTIFVHLLGSTAGRAVEDTWYQVRKRVADMRHTLPQGIIGPGFNDEFGDFAGVDRREVLGRDDLHDDALEADRPAHHGGEDVHVVVVGQQHQRVGAVAVGVAQRAGEGAVAADEAAIELLGEIVQTAAITIDEDHLVPRLEQLAHGRGPEARPSDDDDPHATSVPPRSRA